MPHRKPRALTCINCSDGTGGPFPEDPAKPHASPKSEHSVLTDDRGRSLVPSRPLDMIRGRTSPERRKTQFAALTFRGSGGRSLGPVQWFESIRGRLSPVSSYRQSGASECVVGRGKLLSGPQSSMLLSAGAFTQDVLPCLFDVRDGAFQQTKGDGMANKRFPAIRIIAIALRVFAVLDLVSVFVLIAVGVSVNNRDRLVDDGVVVAVAVAVFAYSVIVAIVLFALAELLTCFTAIEENTRQGKTAVINLQSVVRTAIEEQTEILEQKLSPQSTAQPANVGMCPECGVKFRVTDNMRGQQVACPKCGARFTV